MYTLYRRIGLNAPVLLHTTDSQKEVKDYLISYLKKDGFTESQAMALIEFGIPVKWLNGQFMELRRVESATILQTQDEQLSYTILE